MNPLREWLAEVPRRVLVDTDPAFTQIQHLTDPRARQRAESHNRFFSFGENIGREGCDIPEDGFDWQPTRQPVVLDCWSPSAGPQNGALTTVMQWDSYATREWNGVHYGMKSASFMPYVQLPALTGCAFELALGGGSPPREELLKQGWMLHDPLDLLPTPWAYQRFIAGSGGEFSVAKQGYVISRSGWFSERSAAYLASGRPVIVEDTGFSQNLNVGEGLLAFNTPSQAMRAVEMLQENYQGHCQAARALAERSFDARQVLGDLLARALG
jgi:hypothetical protein